MLMIHRILKAFLVKQIFIGYHTCILVLQALLLVLYQAVIHRHLSTDDHQYVFESMGQGSIVSLLTGGQDPRKLPKNVLFPIIDRHFKREVPENPYEEKTDGEENLAYEDTDKL